MIELNKNLKDNKKSLIKDNLKLIKKWLKQIKELMSIRTLVVLIMMKMIIMYHLLIIMKELVRISSLTSLRISHNRQVQIKFKHTCMRGLNTRDIMTIKVIGLTLLSIKDIGMKIINGSIQVVKTKTMIIQIKIIIIMKATI